MVSEIESFHIIIDRLGDPVLSQRPDRCKVEYVDARDEPYARFQFRYRPVGEIALSIKLAFF